MQQDVLLVFPDIDQEGSSLQRQSSPWSWIYWERAEGGQADEAKALAAVDVRRLRLALPCAKPSLTFRRDDDAEGSCS